MNERDIPTEHDAIYEFCASCIVPIVGENKSKKAGIQGTGTLFQYEDQHFLISADHVLSIIPEYANHIGIPVIKKNSDIITFRDTKLIHCNKKHEADKLDIAMLHLSNEMAEKLKQYDYFFLTKSNICHIGKRERPFYIYGFPFELTTPDPVYVQAQPLGFWTQLYHGEIGDIKIPIDHDIDIFLNFPVQLQKKEITSKLPKLNGISGTTIWHRRTKANNDSSGTIWSAKDEMKCVGVQVSYKRDHWIRAKQWHVVASLFRQYGDDVVEDLRDALRINQ